MATTTQTKQIRVVLVMLLNRIQNGYIAVLFALSECGKELSDKMNNKFQLISFVVQVIKCHFLWFSSSKWFESYTSRFNISSEILLFIIIITCHYSVHNVNKIADDNTMNRQKVNECFVFSLFIEVDLKPICK